MPSNYVPLYFASAVLPDGKLIVNGGEYNFFAGTQQKPTSVRSTIRLPTNGTRSTAQRLEHDR